jgi:hypothetical protein
MARRLLVAELFVVGELAVAAGGAGGPQPAWTVALFLALPLAAGFLIARWWAVALAAAPFALDALNQFEWDEETRSFLLPYLTAETAALLAIGVLAGKALALMRPSEPDEGATDKNAP